MFTYPGGTIYHSRDSQHAILIGPELGRREAWFRIKAAIAITYIVMGKTIVFFD